MQSLGEIFDKNSVRYPASMVNIVRVIYVKLDQLMLGRKIWAAARGS